MTIVVTLKDKDEIIIGADKRVTEGDIIISENKSKILIKELIIRSYEDLTYDKILIAFSGLYSLFEFLKTFPIPSKNLDDTFLEYLYGTFIPKLNNHLRSYNLIQEFNGGQEGVDWELLIAYKNQLFLIEFNLGVIEITTPYYAIGAPRDIALGSLYTTTNDDYVTSKGYIVANAIRACAAHNTLCNNNIELYRIHKTGEIEIIKWQKKGFINMGDRDIKFLLDLYENNNYVKGEEQSRETRRKNKQETKRKNRHLIFDELCLEAKTLIFTPDQKKIVRYLIDDFNNEFQYLHRKASEECIILAFMFFLKKIENPMIRLESYRITKKYGLTDHVFELIVCRLTLEFMKKTPIKPRQYTRGNHDVMVREGKRW